MSMSELKGASLKGASLKGASLKGDDRLPRYQRLADVLRQEISAGQRRPGDRVPSENLLAEEYGIAPGTVRQALARLVSEGILERFHGRGTFVRRPSFDRSLFRFFRFRGGTGEVVVPESKILSRSVESAPSHVARRLEIPEGAPAIAMGRLRSIAGKPVLAEEVWLPLERFRPFLEIPTEEVGPLFYPIYDTACGQLIARAEEELTAEAAKRETADLLNIAPGAPLIVIERLAKGYDDVPLEWRRSRGPADQFHYHTEIR